MNRRGSLITRVSVAVFIGLALSRPALAVMPIHIPDKELADSPIIVVARWEKAPFESHHKYREDEDLGKVIIKSEAHTKLKVIRVIKGDVKPGVHALMVGGCISWFKDGTYLNSATSTLIPGDVSDVTQPNIWFLKREKSWDEKDKTEYLSISYYRNIQPLILEEYFSLLGSKSPEQEVPRLLNSGEPEVVRRVLRFVRGHDVRWDKERKMLKDEADAVWRVIERKDLAGVRSLAVEAYAELKGKECVGHVRELLMDHDEAVRAAAVNVLALNKDEESIEKIFESVTGITDGYRCCGIIEKMRKWGDDRLVPSLISFLENGNYAGRVGDDLSIPAIKARSALREISGHVFPFAVKPSLNAWEKSQDINDLKKRKELLNKLVPCDAEPLKAELVGTSEKAHIRLTNTSKQITTVAKWPSHGSLRAPSGLWGCRVGPGKKIERKEDFMKLEPGQSSQLQIELRKGFLLAAPSTREMTIVFDNMGSKFGVNAWIGVIKVSYGKDWREKREIKDVVEKWPNGNLKAVGQTVNEERFGEWNFFNEEGDRTKIIYYQSNRGSATCNTEHPSNKGTGIPNKKEE